jgi:DDE superfamily endonuclease
MPLPATRLALSHVDTAGNQGPHLEQHAPTRKSVACFGAVSLVTGQFVRMMCAIFNAATFLRFLKRLLRQKTSGQRMILVLDNARYHHALLLAAFLRRHARDLRLLFLPPTARNWPRSSEFGNWHGAWRPTIATSQRFPKC